MCNADKREREREGGEVKTFSGLINPRANLVMKNYKHVLKREKVV